MNKDFAIYDLGQIGIDIVGFNVRVSLFEVGFDLFEVFLGGETV